MSTMSGPGVGGSFAVRPYRPDGGVELFGVWVLLSSLAVAGIAMGVVVHFVAQLFYFILIFPFLIGLVVGAVGVRMVKVGRVRNPWLGGAAGFLAGILAMSVMHYADYQQFLGKVSSMVAAKDREQGTVTAWSVSFWQFMDLEAEEGVQISHHGSKGINLGYYGSWIYWGIEALIVAGVTFAMVRSAAAEPYCRACRKWKTSKRLGYFGGELPTVAAALVSGDIAQIQAAGPRYLSTPVILEADICSSCPNHATTDLRLQHVAVNKKGESTTNTVLHLSYPEEALPQLEPMFAPRTVATSGQSQASE